MVIEGVGYWYFGACIFQCAWTFAFSSEVEWLAFAFMISILVCLLKILRNQYELKTESVGKFWLLQFVSEERARCLCVLPERESERKL